MTQEALNFEDHDLESPYTERDIEDALTDIDRRRAAIKATGNDPGQLFPPFGKINRPRAPRRGATRGGRGRQPRQVSSRRAMPRNGNPGGVTKRSERPGGVPKRPERTVHAMQVELDDLNATVTDQ